MHTDAERIGVMLQHSLAEFQSLDPEDTGLVPIDLTPQYPFIEIPPFDLK